MNELIKITDKNGKQLVSARELHTVLNVSTKFKDWSNRKIVNNIFFDENKDYSRVLNYERAGQKAIEFALTLNMAKKISMSENNEAGNNARDYFLLMEKKAQSIPALTSNEMLLQMAQSLVDQDKKQLELENRIFELENKPQINGVIEHFSILGHCNNIGLQLSLVDAARFGRQCSRLCSELGLSTGSVPDPRYGKVKTYPVDVLNQVIKI